MAQELDLHLHPHPHPLQADDFYFDLLFDEHEENVLPVSDDKYAQELQFQETLMSSVIASQGSSMAISSLIASPSSSISIQADPNPNPEKGEIGESSSSSMAIQVNPNFGESSQSFCEICVERKEIGEMFKIENCSHSFCSECIAKHVVTKIEESMAIVVNCPGLDCAAVLELETCRPMLPAAALERWDKAYCEALIMASQKFYCPYRDCSAMLLNDDEGGEVITQSECPFCHRLFCAQCYVPWHPGIDCEELQWLNEDERGREDLMLREMAGEKKWARCPQCKFYVEKTEGCPHITCRCKYEFCYGCGTKWTASHGGCQRN